MYLGKLPNQEKTVINIVALILREAVFCQTRCAFQLHDIPVALISLGGEHSAHAHTWSMSDVSALQYCLR